MLDLYYKRLPSLTRWKKWVIDNARRKGIVFTYYGRPRLLYKYYASSESGLKAFADRSAVNSIVQGCLGSPTMIELKDEARTLQSMIGEKVRFPDGREGIISSRGTGSIWHVS